MSPKNVVFGMLLCGSMGHVAPRGGSRRWVVAKKAYIAGPASGLEEGTWCGAGASVG